MGWSIDDISKGLDDVDAFANPDICERCNSREFVEPAYFNNTVENLCRWCKKALFTEDLSPWGNEMGKPWGWQAAVAPIDETEQAPQGEGLDDADEFFTGKEKWNVIVSNKNYPGKEVTGQVDWGDNGHFPRVLGVDRNDFGFHKDFAKDLLWAAYWTSDEKGHKTPFYEPFDLDSGNLVQMDGGGIELLRYYNDPEHYIKNNPDSPEAVRKPRGWYNVGTGTWDESIINELKINGLVFIPLNPGELYNIQVETHHWSPTNHYESGDEIERDYQDLQIHYGSNIDIGGFMQDPIQDEPDKPVRSTIQPAGDGLDDIDEFESDDPEIDYQKFQDAVYQASNNARDQMMKQFATLDRSGYELLYVGAVEEDRPEGYGVMKPYAVVGRKRSGRDEVFDV